MGLARSTAAYLRDLGHDVLHLRDQGLQQLDDNGIVTKALLEEQVILTHDLDFGRIVALGHGQLPSVITFRLSNMQPVHVNWHLTHVLNQFSESLEEGALISVSDRTIRVRLLPIDRAAL